MISKEDKDFCHDIGDRVRGGSFFNERDIRRLLIIIKRLDEASEELKRQFAKMALGLEDKYKQHLGRIQ